VTDTTITPDAPVPAHPATPADMLLTVGLVALGQHLHLPLNYAQLTLGAGDIVSLLGIAYGMLAANPNRQSPLTLLLQVLMGMSPTQKAQWNTSLQALKGQLVPEIEKMIDAQIKQRAGIGAALIDPIANAAISQGATAAADAVRAPATSAPQP